MFSWAVSEPVWAYESVPLSKGTVTLGMWGREVYEWTYVFMHVNIELIVVDPMATGDPVKVG